MQSTDVIARPVDEADRRARLERNQAAIEVLRAWREEGDGEEQRETGVYLLRALEEDAIVIGRDDDGARA